MKKIEVSTERFAQRGKEKSIAVFNWFYIEPFEIVHHICGFDLDDFYRDHPNCVGQWKVKQKFK